MAEGARLERVYTGNRIEGSNPSLSAIFLKKFRLSTFWVNDHVTNWIDAIVNFACLFWVVTGVESCYHATGNVNPVHYISAGA